MALVFRSMWQWMFSGTEGQSSRVSRAVNDRRGLGPPARGPAEESIRPSRPITATADIESNLFSPCVRRTCYEPLVSTHLDTQGGDVVGEYYLETLMKDRTLSVLDSTLFR